MVLSYGFVDISSLKGNAEDFWQTQTGRKLTFNNVDNTRGRNIPNPGDFKPLQAECEVGLEKAPFPLHPDGCEDSCAPDRHLNAPLEAAGQTPVLKAEQMHISIEVQYIMFLSSQS